MEISHERHTGHQRIVWMAEPDREKSFVFVLMDGGCDLNLPENDYRHFGFAVSSKTDVDNIASRARVRGDLVWAPVMSPIQWAIIVAFVIRMVIMSSLVMAGPLGQGLRNNRCPIRVVVIGWVEL